MAVIITTTNDNRQQTQDLLALFNVVAALATAAGTAGFQQAIDAQFLEQKQQQLVSSCMAQGRLTASSIIGTCSVNTAVDPNIGPQIAQLQTLITANPLMANSLNVALDTLQRKLVESAMTAKGPLAKYQVTAAKILSTMS
jgi:hypothetical protein